MEFLSDRYVRVLSYKGYNICTLKDACPSAGDDLGFAVDDSLFAGRTFDHPETAMKAINILEPEEMQI